MVPRRPRPWRTSPLRNKVDGKVVDWMEKVTDEQYLAGSRTKGELSRAQVSPALRAFVGVAHEMTPESKQRANTRRS
jgi:hypothetical protein